MRKTDFFDIVQPDQNRVFSIVGDVANKGVSAALYAAYTQSMFQSSFVFMQLRG